VGEVSLSASRYFRRRLATDGHAHDFSVAQARREFRTNGWWSKNDSNCCSQKMEEAVLSRLFSTSPSRRPLWPVPKSRRQTYI